MLATRIRSYPFTALTLLIFVSCALINLWPTLYPGHFLLLYRHGPFVMYVVGGAGLLLTFAVNLIASLEEHPVSIGTPGEHRHVLAVFSLLFAGWLVQLAPSLL